MRFPGRSHFVPEQAASISLAVIFCRLFVEIFWLTASPIFRYDGLQRESSFALHWDSL